MNTTTVEASFSSYIKPDMFDETNEPFRDGLTIIAGPVFSGKTTLSSQIAEKWLKAGLRVGIIADEFPAQHDSDRVILITDMYTPTKMLKTQQSRMKCDAFILRELRNEAQQDLVSALIAETKKGTPVVIEMAALSAQAAIARIKKLSHVNSNDIARIVFIELPFKTLTISHPNA